jgi:hypothetical protein
VTAFERSFSVAPSDFNFFRTKKGRIGWTPLGSKTGDIVCVLYGSNVPFILRDDGDGYHRLVGESYVHGIMFGETTKEERVDEEFVLR